MEVPQEKEMPGLETERWQNAYTRQMREAVVGRLFRGIVHNLNGVVQAFSMQSELFGLMFQQADYFLAQIVHGDEKEKEKATADLCELLAKRAVLAEQMAEKVELCQQIVQGTLLLQSPREDRDKELFSIEELLREEVAFMSADSFFKHKVSKSVQAGSDLQLSWRALGNLRLALQVVLQNAIEAVHEEDSPAIEISARREGGDILVEVQDNGRGVPEAVSRKFFSPFVTDKEAHVGLGLFIASKAMEEIGGQIAFSSSDGGTVFTLRVNACFSEGA